MLDILRERLRQKHRTIGYPATEPVLPKKYRGFPAIDRDKCKACAGRPCIPRCPVDALAYDTSLSLDLGRCIFCTECSAVCPYHAIKFTDDFRLAARDLRNLTVSHNELAQVKKLEAIMLKLFGRSLKLRQVSAGGCNACEADLNVLGTVVFDLGRFGIQFVASPRHADGLVITGPVTENMRIALQKTYDAVPSPKIVIAVGACAISGGIYRGLPEQHNGAGAFFPIDLYIPGCPPHPMTTLDGLLRLLGKL